MENFLAATSKFMNNPFRQKTIPTSIHLVSEENWRQTADNFLRRRIRKRHVKFVILSVVWLPDSARVLEHVL